MPSDGRQSVTVVMQLLTRAVKNMMGAATMKASVLKNTGSHWIEGLRTNVWMVAKDEAEGVAL